MYLNKQKTYLFPEMLLALCCLIFHRNVPIFWLLWNEISEVTPTFYFISLFKTTLSFCILSLKQFHLQEISWMHNLKYMFVPSISIIMTFLISQFSYCVMQTLFILRWFPTAKPRWGLPFPLCIHTQCEKHNIHSNIYIYN